MNRLPLSRLLVAAFAAAAVVPATASAAIVAENAKPLSGVEGESIEHRIVTFDDAGACDSGAYGVVVDWGDGTTSPGTLGRKTVQSTPATCSYDVEGEHTYRVAGSYAVNATITRGAETVTTRVPGTATVREAEVRGEGRSLSGVAGQAISGEVAELRDENRLSVPGDFAATIEWGDGTTSAGQVGGERGRFGVAGGHAYAAPGTYRYVVRVQHGGRSIALDAGTVTVVGGATGAGGGTTTTATSSTTPDVQPTAALRVIPRRLRLATLRRRGVRVRIGVAGFRRTRLSIRLRDARTGRTVGTARVRVTAAQKRRGVANLRVRFSKRTLRKVRARRSYGITVPRQGGLPTQQVRLSVR
jgi:hypothetical protein